MPSQWDMPVNALNGSGRPATNRSCGPVPPIVARSAPVTCEMTGAAAPGASDHTVSPPTAKMVLSGATYRPRHGVAEALPVS